MNLKSELVEEHSKAQCTKVVQRVGTDQRRFDKLFELFLNEEYRVTQRAAWSLNYCVMAHLKLIRKHWKG